MMKITRMITLVIIKIWQFPILQSKIMTKQVAIKRIDTRV